VAAFVTVPDLIMRAIFTRGAFTSADAAAAGATLAAYSIGLIPFVTIRSAVSAFYARKDTATPVKASLTGLTVNVLLKFALMAPLAQIGLALATAVGAWINLLLVLFFSVRAGYLEFDRAFIKSLAKFAAAGLVLSASLWMSARFAAVYFASMRAFRDETALLLLIAVAVFVYGFVILLLFGRGWIFSLLRDRQLPKPQ
jgi:putative peptidoglycan lipid II flippase